MACLGKSPVTALDASSSLSWGKGNRTATLSGGDQNGNNLSSASYVRNALNEYTSRTVPGGFDVLGQANASALVSVNGAGTYRHAEFYQSPVTVSNASSPVWQNVIVAGTAGSLAVTNTGHVLVPPASENFWYDLPREIGGSNRNGWIRDFGWRIASWLDVARFISRGEPDNLLSDGCWTNTWDLPHEIRDSSPVSDAALARLRRCWSERCVAISRGGENRLIAVQSVTALPVWKKLNFAYDYLGRRTRKTVSTWNGSAWVGQCTNLFLYDGWNLISELNGANNSVIRSYVWGQDLSGSMQGAGGVGGLLVVKPAGADSLFVATDANGNVAGLLDAANGTVAATYAYGPFGELIEMNSFSASPNPFRFSTKYCDDETDLIYYGYRYYSPAIGRWLGRDPIGEIGGKHLYAYVDNNPGNRIDALGLQDPIPVPPGGPPIIVLPPPTVPPNIIPFPTPPRVPPIGPPQAAACVVVAVGGWYLGNWIGEETGIHDGVGDWLGGIIAPPITGGAVGTWPGSLFPARTPNPTSLPEVDPGTFGQCKNGCKPRPPNSPAWEILDAGHGSATTHWHWIEYHQSPPTHPTQPCRCHPIRQSSPTKPPGA